MLYLLTCWDAEPFSTLTVAAHDAAPTGTHT
jgi:hypothetical protein